MYVILCLFLFLFLISRCDSNKKCQLNCNSEMNIWELLNRFLFLSCKNTKDKSNKEICHRVCDKDLESNFDSYNKGKRSKFSTAKDSNQILVSKSSMCGSNSSFHDLLDHLKSSAENDKCGIKVLPLYHLLEQVMNKSTLEMSTKNDYLRENSTSETTIGRKSTNEDPQVKDSNNITPSYLEMINQNSYIHWPHTTKEYDSLSTTAYSCSSRNTGSKVSNRAKSTTRSYYERKKTSTKSSSLFTACITTSSMKKETVPCVTIKYIVNSTLDEIPFVNDMDESIYVYVSVNPYLKCTTEKFYPSTTVKEKQKNKPTKRCSFKPSTKKHTKCTTLLTTSKTTIEECAQQNLDISEFKFQQYHVDFNKSSVIERTSTSVENLVVAEVSLLPYEKSQSLRDYITYIGERTAFVYHKNTLALWNYETNMTQKTQKLAMFSGLELIHYQRTLNSYLEPLTKWLITNPTLLREVKMLYFPGNSVLSDIKIAEFEEIIFAMDTMYRSATVTKWNFPQERLNVNGIQKAMAESQSPEELKYYWVEWRNMTGKKLKSLFEQYTELLNLTAVTNGFSHAGEMWTKDYETENFIQQMELQWKEIKPLYRELHAFVRFRLHHHFGDIAISCNQCPIPAHLTGDLWGQNWNKIYKIIKPYKPEQSKSISLKEKGYSVIKLMETANDFYHSLGFSGLPDVFWKKSILVKPGPDFLCDPSAWDMHNGHDFRIKMCYNGTMQDFFDIHHELAHIHYFREYKNLSFPFRKGPNPAFHEAIAGAILLSVKSQTHLNKIGLLDDKQCDTTDINYLMKLALEKLAFLPFSYIMDLWRYKVFSGEIKPGEYNEEWWNLRLKYQGISPAVKRDSEDFDPGSKYHIIANKPYVMNFLSTILEFQFHEALCRRANITSPGEPLHKCDISDSLQAGQLLKTVMQMGASQHWKVAMKELTDSREINTKPMIEFFKPLYTWLKNENIKEGQKVGWNDKFS